MSKTTQTLNPDSRSSVARPGTLLSAILAALLTALLTALLACSEGPSSPAADSAGDPEKVSATASTDPASDSPDAPGTLKTAAKSEPKSAPRHPSERPIPAFAGTTLDGRTIEVRDLLGARSVFYFFNPEIKQALAVSRGIEQIHKDAAAHNLEVIGVGVGSDSAKLAAFVTSSGVTFPVIDDSSGEITNKVQLRAPLGVLGVDPEGFLSFAIGHFESAGDLEAQVETDLRKALRMESKQDTALSGNQVGELMPLPQAPELGVVEMSTGEVLETKALAGRATIVIFFLHTCPHCHKALESIKETLSKMSEAEQPRLVAISIQNNPSAVRSAMAELKLDYFDPYLDPGGKATERWGVTGGVPVVFVVDAQGRIRHRSQGWNGNRDGALLRMHAARAAGATVPMLLDPTGYSGNDVCGVCHEQELATWQFTAHATAFDTLVTHGADRRTDCIGCHVVGFELPGGYDFTRRPSQLEDVGCESCHGRGGPHLSPDFVKAGQFEAVCGTCHNPTHSLGFDYATFHPRVSHAKIASLTNDERAKLRVDGGPSRELLPTQAAYVGSNACQSCHAKEFETWQASPHGHAVATLEKANKQGDATCLACHTTAYGKPGGFAPGATPSSSADLARVGCESCHGPGGDHVGESARRVGTILSLGDKCDSCVILKVCGTCHDQANDPGFEFEVEKRIDAQRHGTIEAAATREGRSAALVPPDRNHVPLTHREPS